MVFEGLNIFPDPVANDIVIALAVLAAGIITAKVAAKILGALNNSLRVFSKSSLLSISRLIELFIFLLFSIVALGVLGVEFARDVIVRIWELMPGTLIIVLVLLLGYILINLFVDVIKSFFLRIGRQEYLREFGVSQNIIRHVFTILKFFLYLVLISIVLNYYARPVPFFDTIIAGIVFTVLFFAGALVAYSYKDYVANSLLSRHVEKNVLKPGQRVKVNGFEGEAISVSSHGVTIELASGYNYVIPNRVILSREIMVKRVRSEITKIESMMKNFTPQLPSHCGPASAKMMLDFFGYSIDQEAIAKEAKTKVPGGTEPDNLISAVKKLSNSEIRGQLIRFDEILNLAQEVKSWIAEGALIILWYKKPVIFPDKQSRAGHYVLCVGVESEELIIMDPSNETAGVYMINDRVLEDAMDDYDISRGYMVFAKKGTSAFWRLSEGLIYGDTNSYKSLSKSFERYLKRQLRQRSMINEIVSEHLLPKMREEKARHVWKPDLTSSKAKRELDKKESSANPGSAEAKGSPKK